MKKVFILLLLLSLTKAFSQDQLPPIYEIKTDTILNETLPNHYWQILEDRSNNLTIDQVSSNSFSSRFHLDTSKSVDYLIHSNWFRFRLKNGMTHDAKIGFYGWMEQSDYYYTSDQSGKWIHKVNGKLAPWSKRDGLKRINYVPVVLQPGQELTIYLRVYNTYRFFFTKPFKFSITFGFTGKVMQKIYEDNEVEYKQTVLDSFLFGFLLFACIFNMFFYYIVHEKVYLFYSIYLFMMALGRFQYTLQLLVLTEHPREYAYVNSLYWWSGVFFLAYFVRYLLKTYQYHPRWDKLLLALTWIQPVFWTIGFFIKPAFDRQVYILTQQIIHGGDLILLLPLLITFFFYINDRKRSTRLLLITTLPSVCIWIICVSLLTVFHFLNYNFNTPIPFWIDWINTSWSFIENCTLCLMVIFFSLNLFLQFNHLKKENARQALEGERLEKEKEIERSQLIEHQKIELEKEVEERTSELKQSLENLKSTQSQLIQSEKMASLGELTAGIAHEIQNPLNFVNNFSEVNSELIEELKTEAQQGNKEEVIAIANDIKANEEKISHHGKRADAIVKGMLQHSRASSSQKESTDINALAEEYLRLTYHGLRAKDKSFNAIIQTDFDSSIQKINAVPQDLGRVLLNLFTNAFYAVIEKKKEIGEARPDHPFGRGYEPTVSVSTKKIDGKVEIHVKDNGMGIPQKVLNKIYQPFFTTKPTGQGTGLGLSLSYDIIKAHGGEIKVETKEGEGAEFIIRLPLI